MYRFGNILFVSLGQSDNSVAMRRVADLAAGTDAQLTLMGVVSVPSLPQPLPHRPGFERAVRDAERRELAETLERWSSDSDGTPATKVVETTNPGLTIIEQAIGARHDLVVVASGDDLEDHASINRLLRECPCPVWVTRQLQARPQRVLAAVNPDPAEVGLNHLILELAASMTELYGGELHLAHAWELYGETTMSTSAFINISRAEIECMVEQEQSRRQQAVADLLSSGVFANVPWQIHLRKGQPTEIVPAVVAEQQINLVVTGVVARTGITGLFIGDNAEQVLSAVDCSVIALKPPGFVSPIQVDGHPPLPDRPPMPRRMPMTSAIRREASPADSERFGRLLQAQGPSSLSQYRTCNDEDDRSIDDLWIDLGGSG